MTQPVNTTQGGAASPTPDATTPGRVELPWETVRKIADDPHVLSVYAAPEFEELSDDGRAWVKAVVEVAFVAGSAALTPSSSAGMEEIKSLRVDLPAPTDFMRLVSVYGLAERWVREQQLASRADFQDALNKRDAAMVALHAWATTLLTRAETAEAALASLRAEREVQDKRAPVQGFSGGIPWSLHLRAYDAYCKKYSAQPALIDLEGRNCRGGFGTEELDIFVPGWRDELSEITKLRAEIKRFRTLTTEPRNV